MAKAFLSATLSVFLMVGAFTSTAEAASFSAIVAYGDSLSDNGNLFAAIGQPPPPYFQGRASNGPVAVEQLAAALAVPLVDFAWFGATTGIGNVTDGGTTTSLGAGSLPGMLTQFALTQASLGPLLANSLFLVWGGPNDFFFPNPAEPMAAQIIARAVTNLVTLAGTLQAMGAQHILVPGMPDLGLTPAVTQNGPIAVAQASMVSAAFNAALQANLPAGVTFFDSSALVHAIVNNPGAYGLTNVTDPCFNGVTVCATPSQYLFWDQVHPTTAGHAIFANQFVQVVATPEPSTLVLAASGLALLARRKRQRRRK